MKVIVESFKYGEYEVLKNINMHFNRGKITLLLGQSGCGKSTLLNIISDKKEYSISYATQDIRLIEKFSVIDNVTLGINEVDQDKLISNAKILGISELLNKKCNLLSGGERQRVTILRALMNNAQYLLLDEPTSNLDKSNVKNLFIILQELVKHNNIGVIITSHESYVKDYCDVIYEYNNYNFMLIKGDTEEKRDQISSKNNLKKISTIRNKYYVKYFLNNLVFKMCLLIIILVSTFFIFGINSYFQNDYDLYYDSLDSNTIVIKKEYALSECINGQCNTSYDFSDITFSEEELTTLSNIEGVSSVSVSGLPTNTNMDFEGNKVTSNLLPSEFFDDPRLDYLVDIRKEIINKSKDYADYEVPKEVNYRFVSVTQDINTINGYGYASEYYHLNNMLYGTNILKSPNEIIIPYSLALYISDVSGYTMDDIIGQEIPLSVQNYETGEIYTKHYNVVGIYDETHTKDVNELGNIYIQGTADLSSEYLYTQLAATFNNNKSFTSLYPDLNSFQNQNDSGITTIVLTIDENYEMIYQQILQHYSSATIITKESFKKQYFIEYKFRTTIFSVATLLVTIVLYIILIKIIANLLVKKKANDIRTFLIIGYDKPAICKLYRSVLYYDLILCCIICIFIIPSILVLILTLFALLVIRLSKLIS